MSKMKKRVMLALILANGMLAGSLMAFGGGNGQSCCKETIDGTPYCCDTCCWFVSDCDTDSDCLNN